MTAVTADLLTQLHDDGFAIVEDVFDPASDFDACRAEWAAILDGVAAGLMGSGRLSAPRDGLPFERRLVEICDEVGGGIFQPFDISLPQSAIAFDTPINVSPAMFALITHDRLLDVVEQIVGPDIVSSPVQHVRFKTPTGPRRDGSRANYLSASVPWHQDLGVILPEADSTSILSCWVAITDADEENGCMRVVPRSHRLPLIEHCPIGQVGIPDHLISLEDAVNLPMRAGSVLVFGQNLVHASLDNTSRDRVRISMDLRYQLPGEPTGRPDFPGFLARSQRPARSGAPRPARLGGVVVRGARPPGRRRRAELQSLGRRLAGLRLGNATRCVPPILTIPLGEEPECPPSPLEMSTSGTRSRARGRISSRSPVPCQETRDTRS